MAAPTSLKASSLACSPALAAKQLTGQSLPCASTRPFRQSAAKVSATVLYAPPATARLELLRDAEERWQRAENSPLDGVSFTPLEFEEALEKFDFSFEIGDKVESSALTSTAHKGLAAAPRYR